MQTDRRAILSLVALGRISPAEAERLLILWNQGWENSWLFVAVIVGLVVAQIDLHQVLPGLAHFAQSLLSGRVIPLHHAMAVITRVFGGEL
jgi:hypothetical protein